MSADAGLKANILIVDDAPQIRASVARWLREAGHDCTEVPSSAEAWQYLQEHQPDLVALNSSHPCGGGLELLPRIKELLPDTEVLLLTALGDTVTATAGLAGGAYGYLQQPLDCRELLLQAGKALEHRRLRLEKRHYVSTLERTVREQTANVRRAHEETILRLVSASQYRDADTGAHIRRTGLYAELFAEVLGWPADQIEHIRMAAPMHDVGKIGIPDAILQKPGALSSEEFQIMKSHVRIGAAMLVGSSSAILQMAHDIALYHHERWDGQGYPRGLSGEAIPEAARIVALVDVYDALTHDRVYRPAMSEEQALEIMEKGRGTHFDPALYAIFLILVPEMRRIAADNPDELMPEYVRREFTSDTPLFYTVPMEPVS
jgi:putative two-component system response regulator